MYRNRLTFIFFILSVVLSTVKAQINTDQVMQVGRNTLYFEDYMLSIQYFNQVIAAKPHLAQPYFYRALAKFNLDDFKGAEKDATLAIERNPFITDAYELRGVSRHNMGMVEEAIADYSKALEMMPESRGILFNKALAQEEVKDYEGASESYERLFRFAPKFDSGYIGRAKLWLVQKDTVKAKADIEKALTLNKFNVNAYVMRADMAINSSGDFKQALADMDEAIRLRPNYAGFYINRAFLRRNLDDYYGAMSDYDYAVQLEPTNPIALYNRSLLRAEVHDFDRAIEDLNTVLAINGVDYRALYNRALINKEKGDYKAALADANVLVDAFPDLAAAYFLRADIKRFAGDRTSESDYGKSMALAKKMAHKSKSDEGNAGKDNEASADDVGEDVPEDLLAVDVGRPDMVAARFTSLLTIDDNSDIAQEYNNKGIRGKVQNRNMAIVLEPIFVAAYYSSPTELKPSSDYMKEVNEINSTRMLRYLLQVTNREPMMSDPDAINAHFESIEYYNSYMASHEPRAIDYFARGMDFVTVRNYSSAIDDFTNAIKLAPDFVLAYFMRGVSRFRQGESGTHDPESESAKIDASLSRSMTKEVLADFEKVVELSPGMAIASYNIGVVYAMNNDYTSALSSFNKAIELDPALGEAYYNRGFVYFKLGEGARGTSDLSKAGELGVVPSYSVLKRMSR